jgi:exopolysaccharide biosynthesis WecB/TagA/CpsF family protein
MSETVNVLGCHFHNVSRPELFERLKDGGTVFTPNVDFIMKMRRDPAFHHTIHQADVRICDSQIVLMASKVLGTPLKEKIAGSDFLGEWCSQVVPDARAKLFLLGAMPGVAAEAMRRINARLGRPVVVGAHSPSYGFEKNPAECEAILGIIRDSGATALAVGVGAPKQENFILAHRDALPGVRWFFGVGATLDFEAGNIPRAPEWMSKAGLEWLFRLTREPGRLWRRYLVDDLPFFWHLLKQRLGVDAFSRRLEPRQ